MNINTGHLVNEDFLKELSKKSLDKYKIIPENLVQEADQALDGKKETYINLKGKSKLANWANKKRKEKKKKRRIVKASRKNNRHK